MVHSAELMLSLLKEMRTTSEFLGSRVCTPLEWINLSR